jgi:sugar phosphate isomerase/epimerase
MTEKNRREFLALVPALAGYCATGPCRAAEKILVGGHPYIYTQHRAELPRDVPLIEQAFSDMSYAGLDGIELGGEELRAADSVAYIRGLMNKHNLRVIAAGFTGPMCDPGRHAAMLERATTEAGRLAELGGHTLSVSVPQIRTKKTPEQLDAQGDFLRKLVEICKSDGLTVNLHNHTYEVADQEYDLRETLARVPGAKLGPDLDWLVQAGIDPVDFIRRYGNRMVFAHLRDRKSDGTWPDAMGEGNLDYAAYGKALRAVGFRGDLVIELAHGDPKASVRQVKLTRPLGETLKISREYVRRVMGY